MGAGRDDLRGHGRPTAPAAGCSHERHCIADRRRTPARPLALHHQTPLLLARLASSRGELTFFSTFTTFGAPLDVTVAALRVEHLFPADAATRAAMGNATGEAR